MIELQDGDMVARIDPEYGNNARSLTLRGQEFISTGAGAGHLDGIPLLAPWANRLDGLAYFANGREFRLNPALQNLRLDQNGLPIHGLVLFTDAWRVIRQDGRSVTSRLEFWRKAEWMAQFPFAHAIEMTHRLQNGALEVELRVENLGDQPMPLCIGFHPYFRLTDAPRDEWRVRIAARKRVLLSGKMIPTGQLAAMELDNPVKLRGRALDDVFTELSGDAFAIEGIRQRLEVRFGARYPVAVVYAPPGGEFCCIEPMTALTNAFNLEHQGIRSELQTVAAGAAWSESFSITPVANI